MMRILVSALAADSLAGRIAQALDGQAHELVRGETAEAGDDVDVAFVSRDITGMSTKHELQPATAHFYHLMRKAPGLRWVHIHAAGADRPIFIELRGRGVDVCTSSGANASVVAQTAVAGVLALARRFPQLMAAQRERKWASLTAGPLPRDLASQTAVIVGWGPVGRQIAALLSLAGLRCIAVRRNAGPSEAGTGIVGYGDLPSVLPRADWLILACPLTDRTRGLVDAKLLAHLPPGAHLVNVARGEVAVQQDVVAALRSGSLGGAYLDVFEHEPLPAESPLWAFPNVIVTPHAAGHSDGNEERVAQMFLANLERWREGKPLANRVP